MTRSGFVFPDTPIVGEPDRAGDRAADRFLHACGLLVANGDNRPADGPRHPQQVTDMEMIRFMPAIFSLSRLRKLRRRRR